MASYPSYDQLAAALPVDIMPGPNDPANFSLPQQVKETFYHWNLHEFFAPIFPINDLYLLEFY